MNRQLADMFSWSWARVLWPISSSELKKFVPLLLLKFFISMVYCILTDFKDCLIVTVGKQSGAELIPILKGWVVFPFSLICVIIYFKICNKYKRSTIFYSIIAFFALFICLYAFVLYPNREILSPHQTADFLLERFGSQYAHWIAVFRNWMHALFFLLAELWGQLVIIILYWGFANHICSIKEAKRTYPLFIAAGDVALILIGPIVSYHRSLSETQNLDPILTTFTFYILLCITLILSIYWWMHRYVLTDPRFFNPKLTRSQLNEKTKLSLVDSIKYIMRSKYLIHVAITMIGCALTINIVEVTWKAHLKIQYPLSIDYLSFASNVLTISGIASFLTVFFLGGICLRLFGWHFSAQIPPYVIGVTGGLFFILCLSSNHLTPLTQLLGITPLMLIVLFGAFQTIANKVVKYGFFDSTKEISYILLDKEAKVKGKAAVDLVGSRLGKSSSSWIQLIIMQILGTSSVLMITPYLLPVILLGALYWSYSIGYLNKEMRIKEAQVTETITPLTELKST